MACNPPYKTWHKSAFSRIILITGCMLVMAFSPVRAHIVEDSLRLALAQKGLRAEERVMAMAQLADIVFYRHKPGEAYAILDKAIRLSEKLPDTQYKARLYAILARQYSDDYKTREARETLDSALHYAVQAGDNRTRGYVHYVKGRINMKDHRSREAISGFLEGLRLLEDEKDPTGKSTIYGEMSGIYAQWADGYNQEKYARLCWSEAVKSRDTDVMTAAGNIRGNSFVQQYKADTTRQVLLDSALYYYKYSLSAISKNRDRVVHLTRLPVAAYHIARIYEDYRPGIGRDTIFKYLDTAIREATRTREYRVLARSYIMQAEYAIAEEDYSTADLFIGRALMAMHKEPVTDPGMISLVSWYSSVIREKQGETAEALRYYKQYIAEYTRLFDLEKMTLAQKLEAQYEASRKERELAMLQEKVTYGKKLNGLYIGLAVVGFTAVFILIYANKQRTRAMKQQKQLHEMEVSKIEQKNRISLLSAMLEGQEQERSRLARDLHDGLGGLLSGIKIEMSAIKGRMDSDRNRGLMDTTMKHLDDAVNELRHIAHSMMPEILIRYGLGEAVREYCNRLKTSGVGIECRVFHYANTMDHSRQMVLYRIMQELVNNAIKHAGASLIYVQLQQVEDKIFLTVEDDGIGFDKDKMSGRQSAGWTNIRARVEFLEGDLDVLSEKGSGTTVTVECSEHAA